MDGIKTRSVILNPDARRYCQCNPICQSLTHRVLGKEAEEREANARLIAAAQELLDALKN